MIRPQIARESLGTQTIEGVLAEGSRTTLTYPIGAIGNDDHDYDGDVDLSRIEDAHSFERLGLSQWRVHNPAYERNTRGT